MSQVTDDKNKKQQKSLQPYQSPHLLIFGALRDLTAGGSFGNAESSPPGGGSPPGKGPPPKPDKPPTGQDKRQRP